MGVSMFAFGVGSDVLKQAAKIDQFLVKCRLLEIDPEPLMERARRRHEQSWDPLLTLVRCMDDELHAWLADSV